MGLRWAWLGRVRYEDAVARMEALRARILEGRDEELLLLLEHPSVISVGRRGRQEHILAEPELLAMRGVAVAESSRGGDVTYHGPGQLVAYPVVRLTRGVVAHVEQLAQAACEVSRPFGVAASFDRACPGVWVAPEGAAEGCPADGRRAKLAAVGVHVHRRVAIHGLALNVTTALDDFSLIVPCGLPNVRATSIEALTGASPSLAALAEPFARAFAVASGRTLGAELDRAALGLAA